ncbi:hypothetical protein GLYMA_16G004001v4 [Glycine max]|nr:hypothetical protein GYH30_043711 [Glycine max]KRH06090.2 hypothetical protein GLYMA_16G004001v4 [Glycine max]
MRCFAGLFFSLLYLLVAFHKTNSCRISILGLGMRRKGTFLCSRFSSLRFSPNCFFGNFNYPFLVLLGME